MDCELPVGDLYTGNIQVSWQQVNKPLALPNRHAAPSNHSNNFRLGYTHTSCTGIQGSYTLISTQCMVRVNRLNWLIMSITGMFCFPFLLFLFPSFLSSLLSPFSFWRFGMWVCIRCFSQILFFIIISVFYAPGIPVQLVWVYPSLDLMEWLVAAACQLATANSWLFFHKYVPLVVIHHPYASVRPWWIETLLD